MKYILKIMLPLAAGAVIMLILLMAFPQIYRGLEWRFSARNDEYRKAANGYLMRMDRNTARDRLVFIGDSQIESMDTSGFTPRAVNFGIGGDTWFGISQRISYYKSLSHAKAIVFLAGINDVRGNSIASILEEAKVVIERYHSNSALYIVSVLPVDTSKVPIALTDIQSLNIGFAKICQTRCVFIDAYSSFLTSNGSLNTTLLERDGIHLNNKGYQRLKAAIQFSINKTNE